MKEWAKQTTADGVEFDTLYQLETFPPLYTVDRETKKVVSYTYYVFYLLPGGYVNVYIASSDTRNLREFYVHRAHAHNAVAKMFGQEMAEARKLAERYAKEDGHSL